jgi:hypothetical protein
MVVQLKDASGNAINLSAYDSSDFSGQIRRTIVNGTSELCASFSFEIMEAGATGKVRVYLTPDDTTGIPAKNGLNYDIFWEAGAQERHRILYGSVSVKENITQ